MTPPTIFDRDTHPLDASWLLTASFYEPRNNPSDHETEADRAAQAEMIGGFHSRANSIRSEQDND